MTLPTITMHVTKQNERVTSTTPKSLKLKVQKKLQEISSGKEKERVTNNLKASNASVVEDVEEPTEIRPEFKEQAPNKDKEETSDKDKEE